MMKRFLIFAGDEYYPGGGWTDFLSDHDTVEEVRAVIHERHTDPWEENRKKLGTSLSWVHVVDTLTSEPKIVWRRFNCKEHPCNFPLSDLADPTPS